MTNTLNNVLLQPPSSEWTEEQVTTFRSWLVGMLQTGPVTVTFNKKDGAERVMTCSLQPELLPPVPVHESNTNNPIDFPKVKKENLNIISVYDLEATAWRSFTVKNVTNVTLKL
jgi:hypothetical protein